MKSLEKATADYEKAKEKMEASKARYEADLKRFKAAEIAKTEAENLEIVKIIRAMDMSIPELEAFKKRMKNELPGRVEIQKHIKSLIPVLLSQFMQKILKTLQHIRDHILRE